MIKWLVAIAVLIEIAFWIFAGKGLKNMKNKDLRDGLIAAGIGAIVAIVGVEVLLRVVTLS